MRIHTKRQRSRGQSLAEFAVIFPVFMFMLGGAIQFGAIFWSQNTLNQIVRDSGRYAATVKTCTSADVTDIATRTQEIAANSSLLGTPGAAAVVLPTTGALVGVAHDPVSDPCPAASNAQHVWVRITLSAQVPIFFPWVPGSGAIQSTALFRMEPVAP